MRKIRPDILTRGKVNNPDPKYATLLSDWAGAYFIKYRGDYLSIVIGPGEPQLVWLQAGFDFPAWDHVSVKVRQPRLPTWDEMHYVKRLCWDDEETVIQIHAPASVYVNQDEWYLHLWKPIGITIPLPPIGTIGNKVTGYART